MSGRQLSYHFDDGLPAVAQLAPTRTPPSLVPKIVGGGILMLGTILLARASTRAFDAHVQTEAAHLMAQRGNDRGEYGKRS
jgi:hypothetical protein